MTQIDLHGMGDRIAKYRKANGQSAEELATKAGNGVTRSIVANIESGRKKDLSVTQLLAICIALEVPPVAVVFDITKPDESTDIPLLVSSRDDKNFEIWQAMSWFGGKEFGYSPNWPEARKQVNSIQNDLSAYKRAENEWAARAMQWGQYTLARRDLFESGHESEWSDDDEKLLQFFTEAMETAGSQMKAFRGRLLQLGVEVREIPPGNFTTPQTWNRAMHEQPMQGLDG